MQIKLRMGNKGEENRDIRNSTDNASLEESKIDEHMETAQQIEHKKISEKLGEKPEEEIADVDSLRQVIKLGPSQGETKKEIPNEKPINTQIQINTDTSPDNLSVKGALELKREILQRIKDFDFQIKKNHEEIENLNQRLVSVTKDLDDLVSLYEIVSEQMNPFVGLSSVTKKRIEALENYTTEIESVKQRLSELEAFAERYGAKLKKPKVKQEKIQEIEIKLSDEEIDEIIEETFEELSIYPEVDEIIDIFLENIKTGG